MTTDDSGLRDCIKEHEEDHIEWYNKNAPCQCADQPKGHCEFKLTVTKFYESECLGYAVEVKCLKRKQMGATGQDIQAILARIRQLKQKGKKDFKCNVKDWERKP